MGTGFDAFTPLSHHGNLQVSAGPAQPIASSCSAS